MKEYIPEYIEFILNKNNKNDNNKLKNTVFVLIIKY